jgi:hypothetical protein
MNVGTVNGSMAPGAPTSALAEEACVEGGADVNFTGLAMLLLGMAFEAEVGIGIEQELAIDGAMRVVTNSATFAQGFVLENEGAGLFAMTLGTVLVRPGHGETAGGLKDIFAVRIVALDTIHLAFEDRMALGQIEFGVRLEMALKASGGIFAGVNDEFTASATGLDVAASRAMTRFTTGLAGELRVLEMDAGMWAGWKDAGVITVTIRASVVADKGGARDFERGEECLLGGGAGKQNGEKRCQAGKGDPAFIHVDPREH